MNRISYLLELKLIEIIDLYIYFFFILINVELIIKIECNNFIQISRL